MLFFVYNNNAIPFPTKENYLICHKGKEIKYNKERSYWIERNGPKSKMKNQF